MRTVLRLSMMSVVLAAVAIVGCGGSKPKDKIIGKWEATMKEQGVEAKVIQEYTSDGTATMEMEVAGQKLGSKSGKYKFTDDNTIEIEYTEGGKTKKDTGKVESIDSEKLVMTIEGQKVEFKKAK